jgi:phosphomecalonate degydratase small subunit
MAKTLRGRCIGPGKGEGDVLVTSQPISFAGGIDPKTGKVNDPRHELFGVSVSGKVLVFPFGKGSSATSLILLELARLDMAPAAIINLTTEPILATGSILCKHFYGKEIPILNLAEETFQMLKTGTRMVVDATEGMVIFRS